MRAEGTPVEENIWVDTLVRALGFGLAVEHRMGLELPVMGGMGQKTVRT